ncbi:response regulator [Rhodoflexus caldus]|uniref:response regulator n=1 Tax=Rhodoflexus caldus TaxID=2891236 RepID=UPI00202A6807|nr:response regulator [Rhodoflexus caldus]
MTQVTQRTIKIMLVSYMDIDNLITSKMIEVAGITADIQIFTDSRLGMEYLRTTESENPSLLPDLIFLAIDIPHYDGFQFLDDFAALSDAYKSRRPVAMLSTSISKYDIERSMSYSYVRKYLNLPLDPNMARQLAEELYSEWHSDTSPEQG